LRCSIVGALPGGSGASCDRLITQFITKYLLTIRQQIHGIIAWEKKDFDEAINHYHFQQNNTGNRKYNSPQATASSNEGLSLTT